MSAVLEPHYDLPKILISEIKGLTLVKNIDVFPSPPDIDDLLLVDQELPLFVRDCLFDAEHPACSGHDRSLPFNSFYGRKAGSVAAVHYFESDRLGDASCRRLTGIGDLDIGLDMVLCEEVYFSILDSKIGTGLDPSRFLLIAHGPPLNEAGSYEAQRSNEKKTCERRDRVRPKFVEPMLWFMIAVGGMAGVIYGLCWACDVNDDRRRWQRALAGIAAMSLYCLMCYILFIGGW